MSQRNLEPGSSSLPVSGRIISPCLPTAHSMNGVGSPGIPSAPSSFCSRYAIAWCVILRPLIVSGRISIARTQRGSVIPDGVMRLSQTSCETAGIVKSYDLMMRSGSFWPNCAAKFQPWPSGHCLATGMSFGSPCGAPASTQRTMVATWSSVSDRSFLNFWMPTVRSICHGGICRSATRALIDLAHGRASLKVISDIGAIESGRWQASHFSRKIGAMSLVNVGVFGASAAHAAPGTSNAAPSTHCVSCLMFVLPLPILRSDGHFHVGIGPAALKAGAALSRLVIGLHPKEIVPGGIEFRANTHHFALVVDRDAPFVEGHLAG